VFRQRAGLARPGRLGASHGAPAAAAGMAAPSGIHRYLMRQRIAAIGQDFDICNERGEPVFKIDGKVRLVRESLKFRDLQGNELYRLQERVIRIRESFSIMRGDQVAARVHNALVDPLRERFQIEIPGGQNMTALGKIVWAEYRIERGGQQVAQISKRFSWVRRDQYVVDVAAGEDDCLILAITVVIDMMVSNGR
jgi:uncharacterized protein YxjI